MEFKCKYCGEEFDNPQIYMIHENNCLDHQEQNGLLNEETDESEEELKEGNKKAAKKAGDK